MGLLYGLLLFYKSGFFSFFSVDTSSVIFDDSFSSRRSLFLLTFYFEYDKIALRRKIKYFLEKIMYKCELVKNAGSLNLYIVFPMICLILCRSKSELCVFGAASAAHFLLTFHFEYDRINLPNNYNIIKYFSSKWEKYL